MIISHGLTDNKKLLIKDTRVKNENNFLIEIAKSLQGCIYVLTFVSDFRYRPYPPIQSVLTLVLLFQE